MLEPARVQTPSREAIEKLQQEMAKLPQMDLPTQHFFAGGMYCRWLPRPKDCLIVGKVHRFEHFYCVFKGKIAVTTDEGVQIIEAPRVIVSKPGTKRAVMALEDSICATIHRTDRVDLDEIEEEIIEPEDLPALFDSSNKLKIESLK